MSQPMLRSRILGLGVGFYSLEQRRGFLDTNCSGLVLKIDRCIIFSIAIHATSDKIQDGRIPFKHCRAQVLHQQELGGLLSSQK
jgi:hypothetical protein